MEQKVYQNSTINALLEGLYQDDVSFAEIKKFGDFGLGTFHDLEGEMVAFDGAFYQVRKDGSISEVKDDQLTPFSVVTKFKESKPITLEANTYSDLKQFLDSKLPSENYIYAFRMDGVFSNMVIRSVPKTEMLKRLIEVDSSPFPTEDEITGTLIGFYFPSFLKDVNVVGYHFHFLSDDKKKGGHVKETAVKSATLQINTIRGFEMILPQSSIFQNLDLNNIDEDELDSIEN